MNYPDPKQDKRSAALSNILKLSLAAGLIFWLIRSGSIRLDYLSVPAAMLPSFCGAVSILLFGLCLSAVRYIMLLRGCGAHLSLIDGLKISAVMYFFTQCVLGPASGDVARFVYTVRKTGDGNKVGAAIMVDRFIGTMGLFMLAAAGMAVNWQLVESSAVLRVIAAPLLALLCGLWLCFFLGYMALISGRKNAVFTGLIFPFLAALICFGDYSSFITNQIGPVLFGVSSAALLAPFIAPELLIDGLIYRKFFSKSKTGIKIGEFTSALLIYRKCPAVLFKTVLITGVQHLCFILSLYLFSQSLNLPALPDFNEIFFAAPLTFLAGIIPAPAAGLGVNEAAFETLLSLVSNSAVSAGASIYLMQRIWITLFSLTGIPFLLKTERKKVASE
ncbi:lysylphosphatidylglycerol synthase transmembrane domain-containing protein [Maridesulfovibrio hydrothermalis]|uniref:Lysylphosphatidylglycerol synthase TM region n=1 Tax=Maridesulfovibrio hydrothermalis AM13 = DSM 14728 TaxID=1121451 RepID=L0RA74_9BACT|nr:lysylphosphatidylglycerol synthase transmembrane domain-containing protein [Maridesulfovibrio hydrothermalis]CCO23117.1 conserved membrane protein of unknown function [Maridesulfovibrio hydrothermalis AM13 = DSM 14728]